MIFESKAIVRVAFFILTFFWKYVIIALARKLVFLALFDHDTAEINS